MKRIYRLMIVLIGICFGIIFYMYSYSIDENNVRAGISSYIDKTVTISRQDDLGEGQLSVYFSFEDKHGGALLSKGLNGRYQVRDLYHSYQNLTLGGYRSLNYKTAPELVYKGAGPKILTDALTICIMMLGLVASYPLKKWKSPGPLNEQGRKRQGWIHWL